MTTQELSYFDQVERFIYGVGRVAWLGCRYVQHLNHYKTAPKWKTRGGCRKRRQAT